jgi:hypothetical protein
VQYNGGPARSAWQIEHPTFNDIIARANTHCKHEMWKLLGKQVDTDDFLKITDNHRFAAMIARVKYYLSPGSIPKDLLGQAGYWKKYYNTPLGAGTVDMYLSKYKTYVE